MNRLDSKEQTLEAKVVYYGAARSGKTTNIELIKQRTPEGRCSEMQEVDEAGDQTLSFGWLPSYPGKIKGREVKIQLHTVRGEVRSQETWARVLRGADCVVLVLDSQATALEANREALAHLREHLRRQAISLEQAPVIVQLNKRDLSSTTTAEELLRLLGLEGLDYTEAVATTGQGVFETLQAATRIVVRSASEGGRNEPPGASDDYPLAAVRIANSDLLSGQPTTRPTSGIWAFGSPSAAVDRSIEATSGTQAPSALGPLSPALLSASVTDISPSRRSSMQPNDAPKMDSALRLASTRPETPRTILDEILGAIRDQNRRVDLIEPALQRVVSLLADQERRLTSRVNELIETRATPPTTIGLDQRLEALASRVEAIEARLDERLGVMDSKVDSRFAAIISKMDLRLGSLEETLEQGITATTTVLTSRTMVMEKNFAHHLASLEGRQQIALADLAAQIQEHASRSSPSLSGIEPRPRQADRTDDLSHQIESLREQIAPLGSCLERVNESLGRLGEQAQETEKRLAEATESLSSRLAPLAASLEGQRQMLEGQRGTIDQLEMRVGEVAAGVERKVEAVLFGLVDLEGRNQDMLTSVGALNANFRGARGQLEALGTTLTGQLEGLSRAVAGSEQSVQEALGQGFSSLAASTLKAGDLETLIGQLVALLSGELHGVEVSTHEALAREHEATRVALDKSLDDTRHLVVKARADLLHQSASEEARISSYSAKLHDSIGRVIDSLALVGGSIHETHQTLKAHLDHALRALHQATREHVEATVGGAHQITLAHISAATAEVPEATARQFNQAHSAIAKSLGDIRVSCSSSQTAIKDVRATLGAAGESAVTDQITALEQSVRDLWNHSHRHFEVVDSQLRQINEVLVRATSPDGKKSWWRA